MRPGDEIRNILAIRFARFGDIVLLMPALAAIKASLPEARLSFLTGHRCAPLAEMCGAIDEVLSIDRIGLKEGSLWNAACGMRNLVSEVRSHHFDTVVDFHGFRETNLLAWFSRAPRRIGLKRTDGAFLSFCFTEPGVCEDKSLHVSDMFRRVAQTIPGVNAALPIEPTLRIPTDRESVQSLLPPGLKVALYVDAPVVERRWPPERFSAVADFVVERLRGTPIVLSGSANAGLVDLVRSASRYSECVIGSASLTIPELATVIGSADLLVSNDTGPMHLGPALGVPTLGLFSVGFPAHFAPSGRWHRFLRGTPIDRISVEDVLQSLEQMRTTTRPDPRR